MLLYWGIDQSLQLDRSDLQQMQGVDFATTELRFDLGKSFTTQQFLTVLNSTISRVNADTLSIRIPGAALVSILGDERETALKWQLRAKASGSMSEIVEQGSLRVVPAFSEVIAAVETPLTSGQLSGDAAVPLAALRVVIKDATDRLALADAAVVSQASKTVGLTLQSFAQDEVAIAVLSSIVVDSGWTWDEELPIYIGSSGVLTQTQPTDGYVRRVATPISSDSLYFEPDATIKTVRQFTDADLSIADLLAVNHGLNTTTPSSVVIKDDSDSQITPDAITISSANNLSILLSSFRPISNTWTIEVFAS